MININLFRTKIYTCDYLDNFEQQISTNFKLLIIAQFLTFILVIIILIFNSFNTNEGIIIEQVYEDEFENSSDESSLSDSDSGYITDSDYF